MSDVLLIERLLATQDSLRARDEALRECRRELTATQEKLAAAEARVAHLELLEAGHRENAADDIADLTAQIEAARNEGVEAAAKAFAGEYGEGITPKRISPAIALTFIYDAPKSTAPVRDDAWALRLVKYTVRMILRHMAGVAEENDPDPMADNGAHATLANFLSQDKA